MNKITLWFDTRLTDISVENSGNQFFKLRDSENYMTYEQVFDNIAEGYYDDFNFIEDKSAFDESMFELIVSSVAFDGDDAYIDFDSTFDDLIDYYISYSK